MRSSHVLIAFLCACAFGETNADDHRAPAASFRVVGYLPDYRVADYDIEGAKRLTDLIVFSVEPSASGELNTERLRNCPWPAFLAFKTKHRVRLLLTIGGWDRSTHFPAVATTPAVREKFVSAVVEFCLAKRLDGVDLDWEHPEGAQQEAAYAVLLNDLRAAFDTHGLLLSVTVAAWQKLTPEAVTAVHYVQVMAYDHDLQHSTFDGAKQDVDLLLKATVPSEKIVLGLPFYGRHVKTREATTYRELHERYAPKPDDDEVQGISFNGPETIHRKTRYAVDSGLAGVMIWELGQDAVGDASLLKVIEQSVR